MTYDESAFTIHCPPFEGTNKTANTAKMNATSLKRQYWHCLTQVWNCNRLLVKDICWDASWIVVWMKMNEKYVRKTLGKPSCSRCLSFTKGQFLSTQLILHSSFLVWFCKLYGWQYLFIPSQQKTFWIHTTKNAYRLPVQNNGSSTAIFLAIKQLVVSSLVSFWRLGPYLFNKHEKTIWWRLYFFRDTEPRRDACFKLVLVYLKMLLEFGNARFPKKPH